MNLYLILLKAFLDGPTYQQYESILDYQHIREHYPELYRLYLSLKALHDRQAGTYTTADLKISFATLYPATQGPEYSAIFVQLDQLSFDPTTIREYLAETRRRQLALNLARKFLDVNEGRENEDISGLLEQYHNAKVATLEQREDFVEDDLEKRAANYKENVGLRWSMPSLNKALGSLRKGDFGFLFARPETGKTTFLSSQVAHMATQTELPILWFNNEEQHEKVLDRVAQSVLKCDLIQLYGQAKENRIKYQELTGGRIKVVNEHTTTKRRVEELCERYKPALIIFDQIDKIEGFADERNDLVLESIYNWARELAKRYGPVIGVCQAGMSAEGKRWLTMNDVNNSKTGKQGEADWILGIGKVADEGLETYRYFHLSKNKLQGDSDSDGSLRHNKWEVRIRPEVAQYEDV